MYFGSEDLTFSEEEGLYVLKALEILLRFWRSGFRDLSPEELGSEDRDLIDLDLDGSPLFIHYSRWARYVYVIYTRPLSESPRLDRPGLNICPLRMVFKMGL